MKGGILTHRLKRITVPSGSKAAPVEGEDYELSPRVPGTPDKADFCITLSDDSMEPYIQSGDTVFIQHDAPLEEFDAGLFIVDSKAYCRQWCVDYAGTLHLLCANPLRQAENLSLSKGCGKSCVCFGKVLLAKKLPRPDYY